MLDLNALLNDKETLYNLSTSIDTLGNIILGFPTVMGLLSLDLVVLFMDMQEKRRNVGTQNHSVIVVERHDWESLWLTNWYFNRFNHHCCHDYSYYLTHRSNEIDYYFLGATVFFSFIYTIAAVILAAYFQLFTLAFILAGVWAACFALKGLAWAIRPNCDFPPSAPLQPASWS